MFNSYVQVPEGIMVGHVQRDELAQWHPSRWSRVEHWWHDPWDSPLDLLKMMNVARLVHVISFHDFEELLLVLFFQNIQRMCPGFMSQKCWIIDIYWIIIYYLLLLPISKCYKSKFMEHWWSSETYPWHPMAAPGDMQPKAVVFVPFR